MASRFVFPSSLDLPTPSTSSIQKQRGKVSLMAYSTQAKKPVSDFDGLNLLGVDIALNGVPRHPLLVEQNGISSTARRPNAITDWGGRPLPLRERSMIALMAELSDKPDSENKVFDGKVVAKWKFEAVRDGSDFSEPMFEFVRYFLPFLYHDNLTC